MNENTSFYLIFNFEIFLKKVFNITAELKELESERDITNKN